MAYLNSFVYVEFVEVVLAITLSKSLMYNEFDEFKVNQISWTLREQ